MLDAILNVISSAESPHTVGLSGFGGGGKTTLARALAAALPSAAVVPGDAFLIRSLTQTVTDDWAGVDRDRLRRQVLDPFRAGLPVVYDEYDWDSDSLAPQALPVCDVLIVEGVGLLHPALSWDLSVWLATPPDVALQRAIARDAAAGHDTADWAIWHETDLRFFARFRPDLDADLVIDLNVEMGPG